MLFELGQLLATPAALNHLALNGSTPMELLRRHARGDWGDLGGGDHALNDRALADGSRVLSAYDVSGLKLYVITESDRSYTTVLLASEY